MNAAERVRVRFFSSTSTHKIDAKGRVSIPAAFRKVLEAEGGSVVHLIPRFRDEPSIEGVSTARLEQLAESLDQLNPFSEEYEALSLKLMGGSHEIQIEDTGRIVLPAALRAEAELEDQAMFVGLGRTFQIWKPEIFEARKARMNDIAKQNLGKLPWGRRPGAAGSAE